MEWQFGRWGNGRPIRRRDVTAECFAGDPLWLVLSTHVNDEFGDRSEADFPYTHEFEWVRTWQRDVWE